MALDAYVRLAGKLNLAIKTGEIMEMSEEFRHLTLQVIAQAILSIGHQESDRTFAKMYYPIVEEGNKRTWNPVRVFIPNSDWFKFRNDVKTLNSYVTSLIVNRWELKQKENKENKLSDRPLDVLDKTLDAISPDDWNEETIRQVRDEVKTFILAGHETSASMLTWSLYELTLNAEYMARVRKEALEVFKGYLDPSTNTITSLPPLSELNKLVYAECCLRESLRKYSNVPTVVRVANEDVDAGKVLIPKGKKVFVNMQGVHHDPNNWPEPLKFIPDR
jgi:cytochrome P450